MDVAVAVAVAVAVVVDGDVGDIGDDVDDDDDASNSIAGGVPLALDSDLRRLFRLNPIVVSDFVSVERTWGNSIGNIYLLYYFRYHFFDNSYCLKVNSNR